MKARVKATGEIVEVAYHGLGVYIDMNQWDKEYNFDELYLDKEEKEYTPDYWEKLKHQYAGMAMQGILNNNLLSSVLLKTGKTHEDYINEVVKVAEEYATALVKKLKGDKV